MVERARSWVRSYAYEPPVTGESIGITVIIHLILPRIYVAHPLRASFDIHSSQMTSI